MGLGIQVFADVLWRNRPPTARGGPSWPSYGRYALILYIRYEVKMIVQYECEALSPRVENASMLNRLQRSGRGPFQPSGRCAKPLSAARIGTICQENTQALSVLRPSTRLSAIIGADAGRCGGALSTVFCLLR